MANTIKTISTSGKAFVDSSGTRFIVRGVTLTSYKTPDADLLSDDYYDYMQTYVLPQLNYLNVNVVRVYSVKEGAGHSKVMELLAQNKIYAMVSLVNAEVSVNRLDPHYTSALYDRLTSVASEFCKYDNTFAFEVGNEVVFPGNIYGELKDAEKANQAIVADAAVIKSMIRDLKAYMAANNLRAVPVGMAMQDTPTTNIRDWGGIGTDIVAEFYACGDPAQAADFIGINSYRYTPNNPLTSYDGHAEDVKSIPVPVFLTESGANNSYIPTVERDWKIVPQMYTEELLVNNLSGQIAFEFFNAVNQFGLYEESTPPKAGPVEPGAPLTPTKFGGAANLSAEFGKVVSTIPPMPGRVTTPSACPARCNPPLIPSPAHNTNVTIQNFADLPLVAVQDNVVLANLPPRIDSSTPSSVSAKVSNQRTLYILDQAHNWNLVCTVAPDKIKEGMTVMNDLGWGGACNISS